MQKRTVLLLFVILLGGPALWMILHRPSPQFKLQDHSKEDPYETIARQTGGKVFRFDKDSLGSPEATAALLRTVTERDDPSLLVTEGLPGMGGTEVSVMVDSSINFLSIDISASGDLPRITALDPSNHPTPLTS